MLSSTLKEVVVNGLAVKAAQSTPQQTIAGAGLIIMAGAVFLLSLIFLALAAYEWLDAFLPDSAAYAITFAGLLVISATLALIGKRAIYRDRREVERYSREEISQLVELISSDLIHDLAEPVRENPKSAMAAATLAGFIVGDRFR